METKANSVCKCENTVKYVDHSPNELRCTGCQKIINKGSIAKDNKRTILPMYRDDFEAKYCGYCAVGCRYAGCYDFRYNTEGPLSFMVPKDRKHKGMSFELFVSAIKHYPIIPIMFAIMNRKETWFKSITKLSDSTFLDKLYQFYGKLHFDAVLLERFMREAWWEKEGKTASNYSTLREKIHKPMVVLSD